MKKFRPESWQAQAREFGNNLYDRLINGDWKGDERQLTNFFALGYNYSMCKQRRKYVERRAAKRISKLINKLLDKEG